MDGYYYNYTCPCGDDIEIQLGWILGGTRTTSCDSCGFILDFSYDSDAMNRYDRQRRK